MKKLFFLLIFILFFSSFVFAGEILFEDHFDGQYADNWYSKEWDVSSHFIAPEIVEDGHLKFAYNEIRGVHIGARLIEPRFWRNFEYGLKFNIVDNGSRPFIAFRTISNFTESFIYNEAGNVYADSRGYVVFFSDLANVKLYDKNEFYFPGNLIIEEPFDYRTDHWYDVKIRVFEGRIQLFVDGEKLIDIINSSETNHRGNILVGATDSEIGPSSIGVLFDDIVVTSLDHIEDTNAQPFEGRLNELERRIERQEERINVLESMLVELKKIIGNVAAFIGLS
ncbi:MAG: family 16 glycoside hydrolase [archaeon]